MNADSGLSQDQANELIAARLDRLDVKDPTASARTIIAAAFMSSGARTLQFWQEQFYRWREGAWRPVPVSEISATVYALFERAQERVSRSKVADVVDATRAICHLHSTIKPPCRLDDPARDLIDTIICANGVVSLDTGERAPLSPTLFCLSALPVAYDANAGKPTEWLQFLATLWPDDSQSIATLQEFAGLLLTPETRFQKIALLVGPKRSGKGTILRTLGALLGADNVAAPTLSSLAGQFGLQPLIGKLAAFIGDARLGGHADQAGITERLLSLSGEDYVSVPRKFLPDYTARLPVRFVLSTNELPKLSDSSGALASRFLVLLLTRSFYGREDLELERRLREELPAILNWCIAGRERLLERGRFVQPSSAAGAIEQLEDLGSPIRAFLRDACTIGAGCSIPVEELYREWRAWCEAQGRNRPGSHQTFGRDLRAACPGLRITQPREGEERIRTYEGIGLLARSGTHANALHSHARATRAIGETRVPSRANCSRCSGEGCEWCRE